VLSLILAFGGAFAAETFSQSAPQLENPAIAALPSRLPMSKLSAMLLLFETSVDPALVDKLYRNYNAMIDGAALDSIQVAAPLTQVSAVSTGVNLSEREHRTFELHRQKIRTTCERAEASLFSELADSLPEAERPKLIALQRLRQLELEIDLILRGAALLGYQAELPGDLGAAITASPSLRGLSSPERNHIATTLMESLDVRRAAWQKAKPGIESAISSTIRMQARDPETGRNGHIAEISDLPPNTRDLVWDAELNLLDALSRSASPAQSRLLRQAANTALKQQCNASVGSVALPKGQPRGPASIEEMAAVILSAPEFTDSLKVKARAILADWIREDQEFLIQQVRKRAAELSGGAFSSPSAGRSVSRSELSIAKLKELQELLGAEWLAPDALIPGSLKGRLLLSEHEARELGASPAPTLVVSPSPSPPAGSGDSGFLPKFIDVRSLNVTGPLDDATRALVEQVAQDAGEDWQQSVESQMVQLKQALDALASAPSSSRAAKREAWDRILKSQQQRAAAWGRAKEVSQELVTNLSSVLAGRAEPIRAELVAAFVAADRTSTINGCSLLENLKGATLCADVAACGLTMRGTPEEHAQVCAAIEAQRSASQVRIDAIRSKVIGLMADFEQAQAAQYPADSDQADNNRKMELAISFAATMEPIRSRANAIVIEWRAANEQLLADAASTLPAEVWDRWRRCWRLAAIEPIRAAYSGYGLEYTHAHSNNHVYARSDLIDSWESWAERIVNEIERNGKSFVLANDKDATLAGRRRLALLNLILGPSLREAVASARASAIGSSN